MLVAVLLLLDWLNSEVSVSDPGDVVDVVPELEADDEAAELDAVAVVAAEVAETVVTEKLLVQAC